MTLLILFGFISGIALGSFISLNIWLYVSVALLGAIIFIYKNFASDETRKVSVSISVFILALLCGLLRMHFSDINKDSTLKMFENRNISAIGRVVSEPDIREDSTKLLVKLSSIDYENKNYKVNERVIVSVPIYPEYKYGDQIKLGLMLVSPKNIISEDGRVFDYEGYLRVRGVWYTSRFARAELISSGNGNPIKSLLFKIKKTFTGSINNALPEPESSLLSGLLLGSKQSLGKDLLLEFQKSGVSHIVVLSGYNIAIVAESIMSTLSFLPKNIAFGSGVVSIVLFTIFAGGGASAFRAAIMVLVALSAKHFNRDYKASRALGFAVVLMLTPNPLLLAFDPSFQLSVLATIGLVFVSPVIEKYFQKVPEKVGKYFPLREIVSTTVATQITVLPYLIYNTGLVSFVSLPVNVLILGIIPITMFFGFVTGFLGIFSTILSFVPAIFTYILLKYQLTIIHIGAVIPFGTIRFPVFSSFVLLLIYIFIFGFFLYKKRCAVFTAHR